LRIDSQTDRGLRPIFILGVPRSGTTLLRVMLGAHPLVAGLPETPWLLGSYGGISSLRGLVETVAAHPLGMVANVKGAAEGDVYQAGRAFLLALLTPYLQRTGKTHVVIKTPGDLQFLEFLVKLYPDALYVHICRDGRDVALSYLKRKGSFFSRRTGRGRMDFLNLLKRWHEWESKTRRVLKDGRIPHVSLRYEDLTAHPEAELRRICAFLEIPYEPAMLDYAQADVDLPKWEAGSTDVRENSQVTAAFVERWRQTRPTPSFAYALTRCDHFLVELGYPPSGLKLSPDQRLSAALYPWLGPLMAAEDFFADFFGRVRKRIAGTAPAR
jgi:hypothetical protein